MNNIFQEAIFGGLAVTTIGGALLVVHVRDVFRAALALAVCFLGIAGLFILLNAEFLAVIQVLIYVGAVTVLIIFAVMLTRDVAHGNSSTPVQVVALTVAALLFILLTSGILQAEWEVMPSEMPVDYQRVFVETPQHLGSLLVREFVLPFEIAGILLLAAVLGALTLVREREG